MRGSSRTYGCCRGSLIIVGFLGLFGALLESLGVSWVVQRSPGFSWTFLASANLLLFPPTYTKLLRGRGATLVALYKTSTPMLFVACSPSPHLEIYGNVAHTCATKGRPQYKHGPQHKTVPFCCCVVVVLVFVLLFTFSRFS